MLELGQVIKLVDSAFFLMAIPNIIALYIFAPEIKREIFGYLDKQKLPSEELHNEISQAR